MMKPLSLERVCRAVQKLGAPATRRSAGRIAAGRQLDNLGTGSTLFRSLRDCAESRSPPAGIPALTPYP